MPWKECCYDITHLLGVNITCELHYDVFFSGGHPLWSKRYPTDLPSGFACFEFRFISPTDWAWILFESSTMMFFLLVGTLFVRSDIHQTCQTSFACFQFRFVCCWTLGMSPLPNALPIEQDIGGNSLNPDPRIEAGLEIENTVKTEYLPWSCATDNQYM